MIIAGRSIELLNPLRIVPFRSRGLPAPIPETPCTTPSATLPIAQGAESAVGTGWWRIDCDDTDREITIITNRTVYCM